MSEIVVAHLKIEVNLFRISFSKKKKNQNYSRISFA
jgi:hypothetical protein